MSELIIANVPEAFLNLFSRYEEKGRFDQLVYDEARLGGRCLYWGSQAKMVVTTSRAGHVGYVASSGFWGQPICISPRHLSSSLCDDVLHDEQTLSTLVELAVNQAPVRLIPYVVSDQLLNLSDTLAARGVALDLQEVSSRDALYRARMFDTKAGFRTLAERWVQECPELRLPRGQIASCPSEAASIAAGWLAEGRPCICKANIGAAGLGMIWMEPKEAQARESIERSLHENPAFDMDPIVVEERIRTDASAFSSFASPSVEACVLPDGTAEVTYACWQLVDEVGHFNGIVIDARGIPGHLLKRMRRVTTYVGSRLGELGYRGYFDIDFVIGSDMQLYAVEGNLRRTGGTHAHEAAVSLLGPRYADSHTVLSRDDVRIEPLTGGWEEMQERVSTLLVSSSTGRTGIIPTVADDIEAGRFGYLVVAPTSDDAFVLERAFLDCIRPQDSSSPTLDRSSNWMLG